MVFEKIFAKLFGKKEESAEAAVSQVETTDTLATPPETEIKVNAEIKSVDTMNVGGLEGVDPATKNLSEEAKEKIASFDEEAQNLSEEVAPAPAETVAPAETETKNFGEVKTNDAGEIMTEIKTEEPTAAPEMEAPATDTESGSMDSE